MNKSNFNPNRLGFKSKATIAPNILPGVKPEDLTEIKCNNCGAGNFHPVHALRVASRFHTVNGLPTLVQFPLGFACDSCNKVNPFDEKTIESGGQAKSEEPTKPTEQDTKPDLGISVSEEVKSKEKIG